VGRGSPLLQLFLRDAQGLVGVHIASKLLHQILCWLLRLSVLKKRDATRKQPGALKTNCPIVPVTLSVLQMIGHLLFPSFPLRYDKHSSDGSLHPVHQQHEKFHRDKVQHPSVPFQEGERDALAT